MNLEDVKIYIKAKRQFRIGKYIAIGSIAVIAVCIALIFLGVSSDLSETVAIAAFIVALLSQNGFLGWGVVSQSQLLEVIERQVNNDPKAIEYLSMNKV